MNPFQSHSFLSLHFEEAFTVSPAKHWAYKENKAAPVLRNSHSSEGNRPVINQVNASLSGIQQTWWHRRASQCYLGAEGGHVEETAAHLVL